MSIHADPNHKGRYTINFIFGEPVAYIYDTKLKRRLELALQTVPTESNFAGIFSDVVGALHKTGNIQDGELANCVTFPAGSTIVWTSEKVN